MLVVANIGGMEDAKKAVAMGGDGVGLLRSEFLFLGCQQAPSGEEQAQIYSEIASELKGKPLVIRTLDVGGDKPLPYLPIAPEENPFKKSPGVWRPSVDKTPTADADRRAVQKRRAGEDFPLPRESREARGAIPTAK